MDAQLKKVFYALGAVLAVCLIFALIGWGSLKFVETKNEYSQNRTITLSSTGKVTIVPDIAKVSFEIFNEGLKVDQISNDNNKAMQGVIDYLKKQGIEAKDIKTTQYSITPTYTQKCNYDTGVSSSSGMAPTIYPERTCNSKISGYKITQGVEVKIRDFTKIDAIVGQLTTLGVNQMSGVSFSIDDSELVQNQAKVEAINQIKAKARILSASTGIRLGRIISISESNNYAYYDSTVSYGTAMKSAAPVAAPIEPGSQEVSQTVFITYEIK